MNRLKQYGGPFYLRNVAAEERLEDMADEAVRDVRAIWFMWGFIAACVFATLVSVIRG